MRRKYYWHFLGLIVFLCFWTPAFSQILVGPKVGAQLSWTNFDNKDNREFFDVKPLPGFNAGLVVAFKVKERFYLHTEYLYSRKGKIIGGKADPALENKAIYHHFDVPILFRLDFKGSIGESKVFKWFAMAGPNISYWLSGSGELQSGELLENDIEALNYDVVFGLDPDNIESGKQYVTDVNRLQLGLNLGVGLEFEPKKGHSFIIDLRYEIGHSLIGRSDSSFLPDLLGYEDDLKARNTGIRFNIAYLIDTKIEERKKGKTTFKVKNKRKR